MEQALKPPTRVQEDWRRLVDLTGRDLVDAWSLVADRTDLLFENLSRNLLGTSVPAATGPSPQAAVT